MLGAQNGQTVKEDWIVWRLVLSGTATLTELDTSWSFDDLLLGNYALTYHQAQSEVV